MFNHLVLLLLDDNLNCSILVTQKILIHNYLFVLLSLFSFQGAFFCIFVRILCSYTKNGGLNTRVTQRFLAYVFLVLIP